MRYVVIIQYICSLVELTIFNHKSKPAFVYNTSYFWQTLVTYSMTKTWNDCFLPLLHPAAIFR